MYRKNFNEGLGKLLASGLWADLTILCNGETIQIHKAVVCAQSTFFNSACTTDMREKREGVVKLEDDVNVVKCFIDFCYTGSYRKEKRSEGVSELLHHAMVYIASEKYNNTDLGELARDNFLATAKALPEPVVSSQELLDTIRYIFANTVRRSDPLRQVLLLYMSKHDFDIVDETAFYNFIFEVPEFAAAYMQRTLSLRPSAKEARDNINQSVEMECENCESSCRLSLEADEFSKAKCPYCSATRDEGFDEAGSDPLQAFFNAKGI